MVGPEFIDEILSDEAISCLIPVAYATFAPECRQFSDFE